jgi:pseudouridine-5'-phosphate glycosidase
MNLPLPEGFRIAAPVAQALEAGRPLVALESTVLTHGLPYPQNLELARQMEDEVMANGAIPATIAVLDGQVWIGATAEQLAWLVMAPGLHKISSRDLSAAISLRWSGGTTVAGTMVAAHRTGIRVFATGGIGGVHREAPFDISADLPQLAGTPMVVVCAGAKAILDLPATLEYLETAAVPVVGYRTDEFPAFYSRESRLPVSARAESPGEIAALAWTHWSLGMTGAVLVANPPPVDAALPAEDVEGAIRTALLEAQKASITGQRVTPFLLERVNQLTGGASMQANLALLLNNARLAAEIARVM